MEKEHAEVAHASAARYILCWLALAVLTVVTFALSSVKLGEWSLIVALLIAVTKATVVSLFFMHLWDYKGASRLIFAASVIFVSVLIILVLVDVGTRFPFALPVH